MSLSSSSNSPSTLDAASPLAAWLSYIESLHTRTIDLGLERISLIAQQADLTHPAPKVITVAGTNGKGSTCAILEAILLQAGYSTGVYSSPHLIRYNERVRINGKELDDERHTEAFAAINALRGEQPLSFFEFATLAALWLYQQNQVDVVILEVGLGGRLDATNVVDHDVAVITSLALDHTDWLGDDIAQIGAEKAGIFRANKPAICGEPHPPATVAAKADEIGAILHQVGYQFEYERLEHSWNWRCGAFDLCNLPLPKLPLANAATALMALGTAELNVSDKHIVAGLEAVTLAGRMEQVGTAPVIILDVAHNPHSATYLAEQIQAKKTATNAKVHAVVAMLKDKDIKATLAAMAGVVDNWYLASLSGARGAAWTELAAHLPPEQIVSSCALQATQLPQGFDSPRDAFVAVKQNVTWQGDIIIVFGSFYTVGEIADFLSNTE